MSSIYTVYPSPSGRSSADDPWLVGTPITVDSTLKARDEWLSHNLSFRGTIYISGPASGSVSNILVAYKVFPPPPELPATSIVNL